MGTKQSDTRSTERSAAVAKAKTLETEFRKRWIAQDQDGTLVFYAKKPEVSAEHVADWWFRIDKCTAILFNQVVNAVTANPDWKDALVNLRTDDWSLDTNGHLIAIPKEPKGGDKS